MVRRIQSDIRTSKIKGVAKKVALPVSAGLAVGGLITKKRRQEKEAGLATAALGMASKAIPKIKSLASTATTKAKSIYNNTTPTQKKIVGAAVAGGIVGRATKKSNPNLQKEALRGPDKAYRRGDLSYKGVRDAKAETTRIEAKSRVSKPTMGNDAARAAKGAPNSVSMPKRLADVRDRGQVHMEQMKQVKAEKATRAARAAEFGKRFGPKPVAASTAKTIRSAVPKKYIAGAGAAAGGIALLSRRKKEKPSVA